MLLFSEPTESQKAYLQLIQQPLKEVRLNLLKEKVN